MQPITITDVDVIPFKIPFIKPFAFGNKTISERGGFYLALKTADGLAARGEIAPLEGVSHETLRHARHDLTEISPFLKGLGISRQAEELLAFLRQEPRLLNASRSVRFGVESALLSLASTSAGQSLVEFLGGHLKDVATAVLLQGTYQEVMADFKRFSKQGARVFKLKVGDRNIALDVKKINDLRLLLEKDSHLRLDGNRVWGLKEACVFAGLAGNHKIEFIEEPVNDPAQLDAFYQQTGMRVALDETLGVVQRGIQAPGRCSPPLARQEGVVAYVLKPMVLGLVPTLDWMKEAGLTQRKAIISSAFESPVGFKVLANLASLTTEIAGLGTERWFKDVQPAVGENGIIPKELLI